MNTKKTTLKLILIIISLSGCLEKGQSLKNFKGTFSGTFTYYSPEAGLPLTPKPIVAKASVTFSDSTYVATSNPNHVPAGGGGKFKIIDKNKVHFEDDHFYTANFDWGLVLSGDYNYKIKGDSLFLNKIVNNTEVKIPPIYEYRLKLIK